MYDMVKSGIEYANSPTDRYINENGQTDETVKFKNWTEDNISVYQGDSRKIPDENEYDAVITDPPYYNNIIYSELSDFFYVWQKILLEDEYEGFDTAHTPRAESIVSNPAEGKGRAEFEVELKQAFGAVERALKPDGSLVFTYHHSDSESWGELLEALCETGFEVTAAYPISADIQKFTKGAAVSFDIIIVARPAGEREPISWNALRRRIHRTADDVRDALEENRDLSAGDVGVIEMGKCFQEYSKHHGAVRRAGEEMTAKEVVAEIYGIIQENAVGEQDVYLDLLGYANPT
ncbi:MAG TPA: DNA methyltransferase, partial [Halococcus sp.]|nr:DNA methyltransferase [Halococcus sp.]